METTAAIKTLDSFSVVKVGNLRPSVEVARSACVTHLMLTVNVFSLRSTDIWSTNPSEPDLRLIRETTANDADMREIHRSSCKWPLCRLLAEVSDDETQIHKRFEETHWERHILRETKFAQGEREGHRWLCSSSPCLSSWMKRFLLWKRAKAAEWKHLSRPQWGLEFGKPAGTGRSVQLNLQTLPWASEEATYI